ncbi:MAG: hypothetical protein M1831_005989 [Alyxoria varia]|nr:MAG: hypothetical protein M1831_005989 [Alyxoria varia]
MGLDDFGHLAVAEIVLFIPIFLLAQVAIFRHGLARKSAWLFLTLFALTRIIGSACRVAGENQTYGETLNTVATVMINAGFVALIHALLSLLSRVNDSMPTDFRVSPNGFRLIHVALLVAIILGIIRGVKVGKADSIQDASDSEGLSKAGSILTLLAFIAMCGDMIVAAFRRNLIKTGERRVLVAAMAAAPFVLIRTIYSLVGAFSPVDSAFGLVDPSVWARAFMAVAEEFIASTIIVVVGLFLRTLEKDQPDHSREEVPMA